VLTQVLANLIESIQRS